MFIMSRFKSGLRDRIASSSILIVPWFRISTSPAAVIFLNRMVQQFNLCISAVVVFCS